MSMTTTDLLTQSTGALEGYGHAQTYNTTAPDIGCAWSQIAAVYIYMYIEKLRFAELAIVPSAKAEGFFTKAEAALTQAKNYTNTKPPASVAWANTASDWAALACDTVRVENTTIE